jgi:hypothetical protein
MDTTGKGKYPLECISGLLNNIISLKVGGKISGTETKKGLRVKS